MRSARLSSTSGTRRTSPLGRKRAHRDHSATALWTVLRCPAVAVTGPLVLAVLALAAVTDRGHIAPKGVCEFNFVKPTRQVRRRERHFAEAGHMWWPETGAREPTEDPAPEWSFVHEGWHVISPQQSRLSGADAGRTIRGLVSAALTHAASLAQA